MAKNVTTKDKILETAISIIKTDGLKTCSMRSISKKAEIAVGTIYNYFPSQEELLESIFNLSWNITLEKLRPICGSLNNSKEKLSKFINILRDEIEARDGLGKKLFAPHGFSMQICSEHNYLFNEIISIISSIISQSERNCSKTDEEIMIISRWVFMIVMDNIIYNKVSHELFFGELSKKFL